jgi:hypothetical protein
VHFSNRLRAPTWRKLLVALTIVTLAVPLFALPADASSADRLTVRINSPKANDTVSGFVNVSMTCNPQGQLGVPARRENTPYRTFALQYASGANAADSDFNTYRLDSWTYKSGILAAGLPRADRSTYVPPGVGSVRPPRLAVWPWDSTTVPDGPATIRLRCFGYDGSVKDAKVTVNVQNNGASPEYTEMIAPKNGDTVAGWTPITFTAMPRRQGIQQGIQNTPWTTFLPSCLDIDINYWKVEYAPGANPSEETFINPQGRFTGSSEWIAWAFSDYGYATSVKEQIPRDGKGVTIGPAGCAGSPVFTYNGGTTWNSTLVPDGPASIRVTIVYNDGSLKRFQRVVNVQNNGKGVQYFGLDRDALSKTPLSGDNAGIPGYADVPFRGIPKYVTEWPTRYYACDIAAGDQMGDKTDANWTMFWVNDNTTWNEVRDAKGFTIGGETRLKDWTHARSYGRSGALCRLDTTTVPNGVYTIRLRQALTDGTTMMDWAKVEIKN